MVKSLVFIIAFFTVAPVFAQTTPSIDSSVIFNLSALDSLLLDFDSLDKPQKSYFDFTIGIGNKEFSQKNNAVNANQTNITQLYYTPSISYFHKSGLCIAVTPYISTINNKLKNYQTAVRPGYSFSNKKISFSFDYTRYFADNKVYNGNSIFQNELYASFKYKKYKLQPALSIGYSSGKYNEINIDTLRTVPQLRLLKDSTNNTISDFNLSVSATRNIEFEKIFFKKDVITFSPQVILTGGTQKYNTTHVNKIYTRLLNVSKKVRSLSSNYTENFSLQTLALSLTAYYEIGNFTFTPNVYFSYYLPSTTYNRLNAVYSFSVGYTF
jgi:hypothetical protein